MGWCTMLYAFMHESMSESVIDLSKYNASVFLKSLVKLKINTNCGYKN